jgi:hypothetical protein
MYNMEISIGSYKFRLEILIIIFVVFWIMWGHMLCSCSKVGLIEGFEMAKQIGSQIGSDEPNNVTIPESKTDKKKEGFIGGNNTSYGPEFSSSHSPDYIMNPSKWAAPTLTYSPGTTPDTGVQAILNRPKQPIPLPDGELDFFATTQFKPECCPNAFSSSTGCACMTVGQYNYLRDRGGNNVPYSEY